MMREISAADIEALLARWQGGPVTVEQVSDLGMTRSGAEALKRFGYGKPVQIIFRRADGGERRTVVLRRVGRNGFGRERGSDRAAEVWRDYHTFSKLPRHVPAEAMVLRHGNGTLEVVRDPAELLLLTGYVPGRPYAEDLFRLRQSGEGSARDRERVGVLAEYLAAIHEVKHDDPLLWRRRLRDLVGHGEGIMGLTDSYPADETVAPRALLLAVEEGANRWRWRLKAYPHRLSQVHGDFHPFNILFDGEKDLYLVDRSRGEWGAPEDDVSCLTINYLFFSLQRSGKLTGVFQELYELFWESYLDLTHDDELPEVIAPWFAWRALVLASPVWYPDIDPDVREKLLAFAQNVMAAPTFEWRAMNDYLAQPQPA